MLYNITDSEKYLYHYTSACTAISYIFYSGTIRFSSYTGTNDPMERKNWLFDFGTNEDRDLSLYNRDECSDWLTREFKSKTMVSCFSMDGPKLSGNYLSDIALRGFCKPRMWAQYGDNHRGVCLVFNRSRLEELVEGQFGSKYLIKTGPVNYVDRSVGFDWDDQQFTINVDAYESLGRDEYFRAHLKTHYKKLFFEKMTDWQGENEWRIVVFSNEAQPLFLNFEDSLVGVVFGDETSGSYKDEIIRLTSGRVWHIGLRWKNCAPWYDFK